ncbi:MAG: hypothetical protein J1G05_00760 [Clostridiales bacterium]|nr:hypothetical protein [Clostridiales bacterium]
MKTLMDLSSNFFDLLELNYRGAKVKEAANDKLCFANALKNFLSSGRKEDAFTVYFCFCEIFELFGKGYENTKKLLELLSDHEYHSGELLSKHRDHYSHSVYVFALGLAIYANDSSYHDSYLKFYNLKNSKKNAFQFLKYWGMTALFHDIGYPFQLAHEQIKTYSEEVWGKNNPVNPYVSYGNLLNFIAIEKTLSARLSEIFSANITNINDLLAYGLNVRDNYDAEKVSEILVKRIVKQPNFMDHGYFSAVILARQLLDVPGFEMDMQHLDVLTAILLHNSFNKYDAPDKHSIDISEHPLSYLLILCDELQCWDRLAYGKISKRDPIAWDVEFEISTDILTAKYIYDSYTVRKYDENGELDVDLNKNYKEMREGVFLAKIYSYIVTNLKMTIKTEEKKKQRRAHLYASDDNFINLCDLAKAIHISYNDHCKSFSGSRIDEDFGKLPLEFKVSNIEQAKSYASKLELINCFYSGKDLDYPVVEDFGRNIVSDFADNIGFLCHEEHVRWVKEKLAMGWKYGTEYKDVHERNQKKIHKSIVPYELLSDEERSKDKLMVNNIIDLLKKFHSNIKIYNYRTGRKPILQIAVTGHRYIKDDPEKLKKQIKEILSNFSKNHRVIVRSCFAYGADQLVAECAAELGISIKANIPMPYEEYIEDVRRDVEKNGLEFTEADELRMRHLLAQAVVCKVVPDPVYTYAEANAYIINKCDKLIALWDGKPLNLHDSNDKPINRGGTYDCMRMAEQKGLKYGEDIIIVECYR